MVLDQDGEGRAPTSCSKGFRVTSNGKRRRRAALRPMLTRRPQREPWPFARDPLKHEFSRVGNAVSPTDVSLRFRYSFRKIRPRPCRLHPETDLLALLRTKGTHSFTRIRSPRKPHQ